MADMGFRPPVLRPFGRPADFGIATSIRPNTSPPASKSRESQYQCHTEPSRGLSGALLIPAPPARLFEAAASIGESDPGPTAPSRAPNLEFQTEWGMKRGPP